MRWSPGSRREAWADGKHNVEKGARAWWRGWSVGTPSCLARERRGEGAMRRGGDEGEVTQHNSRRRVTPVELRAVAAGSRHGLRPKRPTQWHAPRRADAAWSPFAARRPS